MGSFEMRRPTLNLSPSGDNLHKRTLKKEAFAFLPACPHFCWQIHVSCLWGIPLLVLELASLGFQFRLKINNSLELPWDSRIRWELLRYPALWNEQLPGHWLFCQKTSIIGFFFSDYSLYSTLRNLLLIYMEYSGLNENDCHRFIYLNTLSPVDWEGLGGVVLFEELLRVDHELKNTRAIPSLTLFLSYHWFKMWVFSCHSRAFPACLLPWGPKKRFLVYVILVVVSYHSSRKITKTECKIRVCGRLMWNSVL